METAGTPTENPAGPTPVKVKDDDPKEDSNGDKSPIDDDDISESNEDLIDAEIDKCFDVEIQMIQEMKKDEQEQITEEKLQSVDAEDVACSSVNQSETDAVLSTTNEQAEDKPVAIVDAAGLAEVDLDAAISSGSLLPDSEVPSSRDHHQDNHLPNCITKGIPASSPEGATASASTAEPSTDSVYHLKWVEFNGIRTPIITQRENGPCPLIAIINVLLMSSRVSLSLTTEVVTCELLIERLADCLLKQPQNLTENAKLDYQQNVNDAMAVIPRLQTGIDVNVKFTGVRDFEYTPECIVFDLLNISLYHGWLIETEAAELRSCVDNCSYNQLVEKIIEWKGHSNPDIINQAYLAESFLNETAAQLTYHGLCELNSTLKDEEMCVFFRNNHFSTLYKHNNSLWLLVTDQGFLSESQIVWESLDNVEGDSVFVDGAFRRVQHSTGPVFSPPDLNLTPEQLQDHDFMVALTLQQQEDSGQNLSEFNQPQSNIDTDHALAMQLQAEEERQSTLEQRGDRPVPPSAAHPVGWSRNTASPPASSRQTSTTTTTTSTSTSSTTTSTGAGSSNSTKDKDDKCQIL